LLDFGGRDGVMGFERDPETAGRVGGRDDAGALDQFGELFGSGLERQRDLGRAEWGSREHFARDFEYQIVTPLDVLGGMGQAHAVRANEIDVHSGSYFISAMVAPVPPSSGGAT
jgi:hypothetical protein